jgi:hypothetical protein
MKLWTEMKRDTDGEWFANDPDPYQYPDPYQCKGAIARDAVAAHALMQAIKETRDNPYLYGGTSGHPESVIEMIERRASEIMAEWGFDTGEVE